MRFMGLEGVMAGLSTSSNACGYASCACIKNISGMKDLGFRGAWEKHLKFQEPGLFSNPADSVMSVRFLALHLLSWLLGDFVVVIYSTHELR